MFSSINIKKYYLKKKGFKKFKIIVDLDDRDVSQQILKFGWYNDELITTKAFKKYLKRGMKMLDLGANIGFYTLLARTLVGPTGRVFAFEPDPRNVKLIRMSIKENNFRNIKVEKLAVSDQFGQAKFYLSPDFISEHSLLPYTYSFASRGTKSQKIIRVKTVSIDYYLENKVKDFKVDLIKMDIEGAETRALKGMRKTLKVNKNLILITEFWPDGFRYNQKSPRWFLKELVKLRFQLYHLDELKQKIYPVSINRMMEIANLRSKNHIETNKENWYTNFLCIK